MTTLTTHDRLPLIASASAHPGCCRAVGAAWLLVGVTCAALGSTAAVMSVALSIAGAAAIADLRSGLLPDRLVLASAVPVLASLVQRGMHEQSAATAVAVGLGILGFAGPLFVAHVIAPEAIGFGDVKLAGSLGAAVGLVDPMFALVGLFVACGLTAMVGLSTRRSSVAFGPGLVTGAIVASVVAHPWSAVVLRWH